MEFLLLETWGKGRDEALSLLSVMQGHREARLDGESLHWEGKFGDDNTWLGTLGPLGEVLKEALAGLSWHDSTRSAEGWGDHGPSWSLEVQLVPRSPLCLECPTILFLANTYLTWNTLRYGFLGEAAPSTQAEHITDTLLSSCLATATFYVINLTSGLCTLPTGVLLQAILNLIVRKTYPPCEPTVGRAPNKIRDSRGNEGVQEQANGSVHKESPTQ